MMMVRLGQKKKKKTKAIMDRQIYTVQLFNPAFGDRSAWIDCPGLIGITKEEAEATVHRLSMELPGYLFRTMSKMLSEYVN